MRRVSKESKPATPVAHQPATMMSPTSAPVTAKREVLRNPACAKANAATATPIAMAKSEIDVPLSRQAWQAAAAMAELPRSSVSGLLMAMRATPVSPRRVIIATTPMTRKRDQRFQVAAAKLSQSAEPAGAVERHAKTEQEAADDQAAQFDARAGIDRARQIELGPQFERVHADDRDGDRQDPAAQPARVIGIDRVLDGAERAEAAAPRHKAEREAEPEAEQRSAREKAEDRRACQFQTFSARGAARKRRRAKPR